MMMVARALTIDMHAASTSVDADLSLPCLSLKVHKQYLTMDPARIMEIFIYRGSLFNLVGPGFRFSLSTYGSFDEKKGAVDDCCFHLLLRSKKPHPGKDTVEKKEKHRTGRSSQS